MEQPGEELNWWGLIEKKEAQLKATWKQKEKQSTF